MATTCKDVFDLAMGLIDSVNESTGATDTSDNREYKMRTLFILNTLRGELYPFSDTYPQEGTSDGKRPIVAELLSLEQEIGLDDFLCQSILPYGLAAHLLLTEDPATAAFFQQRYEELRDRWANVPTTSTQITDLYGGIEYGEFSRW